MPRTEAEYKARVNQLRLEKYHRRKAEAIIKLGGLCVDCGAAETLEFDHVDPASKTRNITELLRCGSQATVDAELVKCVLRCCDCHRIRSLGQQQGEHGEGVTGRKKCMCELCGPLKRAYWRKRKREEAGLAE